MRITICTDLLTARAAPQKPANRADIKLRRERLLYRMSLNASRTKQEARLCRTAKTGQLLIEAKRVEKSQLSTEEKTVELGRIAARSSAMEDEYKKYTSTRRYKSLPEGIPEVKKKNGRKVIYV